MRLRVAASGTSPYWTFTGTGTSTVIASKIPTNASALFSYLDANGSALAIQTASDDATTGLVKEIQINLQVDSTPGLGAGPVTLTNTVVLALLMYRCEGVLPAGMRATNFKG